MREVATAVFATDRKPLRLNVANWDTIEKGAPLCQMKIEPVCHPLTSNPSARPGELNNGGLSRLAVHR